MTKREIELEAKVKSLERSVDQAVDLLIATACDRMSGRERRCLWELRMSLG